MTDPTHPAGPLKACQQQPWPPWDTVGPTATATTPVTPVPRAGSPTKGTSRQQQAPTAWVDTTNVIDPLVVATIDPAGSLAVTKLILVTF